MAIRIAINGFGRIGRAAFKSICDRKDVQLVAINDLMDPPTAAHLLKYDTVYGQYAKEVVPVNGGIKVAGKTYPLLSEKEPAKLPWKKMKVDVVLECTGRFTDEVSASAHITAGAKRVIISAPAKDDATQTLVLGTDITAGILKAKKTKAVISNASCTTNCISPVMQVLASSFGVEKALMTTIHSYTADQALVDGPHRDLRRARAAAQNIIPTTTGAAIATTKVVNGIEGRFDGISIRVPTICGSISDITAVLSRDVTVKQVNDALSAAAKTPLFKNILSVTNEELVSSDFVGSPYSAIVDLPFTRVVGGNLVKILAWYDNEWAYSLRLVDLALAVGRSVAR
jgi:glyceraldehyde 3-phosphate dehydrogenase